MCADFAIHNTDGHNPHAHILLTVRPLNENGTWQYKTEKEYLCIKNGEEKGFTATEFKTAQKDGWEKQYRYKVGKKKIYMTASDAQESHSSNSRSRFLCSRDLCRAVRTQARIYGMKTSILLQIIKVPPAPTSWRIYDVAKNGRFIRTAQALDGRHSHPRYSIHRLPLFSSGDCGSCSGALQNGRSPFPVLDRSAGHRGLDC